MSGGVFARLRELWLSRDCADEFFGTLVNAYIASGSSAWALKAGRAYVDVGTFNGYRAALGLLHRTDKEAGEDAERAMLGWPSGRPLGTLPKIETSHP